MKKITSLEELVKKYLSEGKAVGTPDSYDLYKHKSALQKVKSYSDAVGSLYASSKRALSTFGKNSRKISNKGLQNSGYSSYIDELAKRTFASGLESLKQKYASDEVKSISSYASYLDRYKDKIASVKKNVMSHLVSNNVVDLNTAIAYGMSAGLSKDDAAIIGESAYKITRQKVLNNILEQTANLGLDKEGARMLAIKMGFSEEDAKAIADEVDELLRYYSSLSEDRLEDFEQKSQ